MKYLCFCGLTIKKIRCKISNDRKRRVIKVTDLTKDNPTKTLIRFALPMIASVIFQQIYNIADKVIAGQFAGEDALAAVSASYPITMIIMAFALGTNIGCSVVISRFYGAKKYSDVKTTVTTSFFLALTAGITLSVISKFLSVPILRALNTPDNIFADAAVYLDIYIYGFLFLYLYNICTGVFNALGNSRTPLYFLIASSIGNIILDYVFVAILGWGVAGVAWATFIAQGISCILSIIALIGEMKKIRTTKKAPLVSSNALKKIFILAIPSILQQSFVSIGTLMIQGMVNSYGSSVIAGYGVAIQLNTFAITVFNTSRPQLYIKTPDDQLAFRAISDSLAEHTWIPVGVYCRDAGEYTFSLYDKYVLDEIEAVYLHDNVTGITTNLLYGNYKIETTKQLYTNTRFTLNVILRRKVEVDTPTVIEHTENPNAPRKFFRDGVMYIMRDGKIYDLTGKPAELDKLMLNR